MKCTICTYRTGSIWREYKQNTPFFYNFFLKEIEPVRYGKNHTNRRMNDEEEDVKFGYGDRYAGHAFKWLW